MRSDLCRDDARPACYCRMGFGGRERLRPATREPSRVTGLVNSASALEDLFRAHRDWPAPPALVPRHGDVIAGHLGRLALPVAERAEAVVARGVMRLMLPPRPPRLARPAPTQRHQHTADQHNPPPLAPHNGPPKESRSRLTVKRAATCYSGVALSSNGRLS